MDDFLADREPRDWQRPTGMPSVFEPEGLYLQEGSNGLEVVAARAKKQPSAPDMRAAHKARRGGRAAPVLFLARYTTPHGERLALCGPVGEPPMVYPDVEPSQAARVADTALNEPNRHAATRFLLAALAELGSQTPGLRNAGFLATQELEKGVPKRSDWKAACKRAEPLLPLRGRALVESLGYEIAEGATNASILKVSGRKEAVAVFCDDNEPMDAASDRFDGSSPVSRALALADREGLGWVVLTRASEIRLYAAKADIGVGRRGRAETFVELNLPLVPLEQAGYLPLLFSAEALSEDGSLHQVLGDSKRYAADLAIRLRDRIYDEAVPALARAIAARLTKRSRREPGQAQLEDAYEQVMVILFRLLFVAYAEDRDLLPYRTNNDYADHSLTRRAQRLAERAQAGELTFADNAYDLWNDVRQLWQAVNEGNSDWGVPVYNGGLFSEDANVSRSGAALAKVRLTNAEFGPALAATLTAFGAEGVGPVDFRALSVREFGTIYEGLLESRLSVAPDDLTLKNIKGEDQFVPAKSRDKVAVEAGEVYFHHRSGARKATGSYFTKPFAVEYLLDHSLEPALDDHLARLEAMQEAGDQAGLADAFFDFRCADTAMGSAHFLVAAVDRIEARLSAWLSLHPAPAVTAELQRLRGVAEKAMGELGPGVDIETGSLLRRQIARHCIYGVDKNRVAVELARLAIWVHTFVPGLPLSFLDHNLVHGDSLTGVGTLDEVVAAFDPDADPTAPSLFRSQVEDLLAGATKALARLARTSDATKSEIDEARQAHADAQVAVGTARAVFDVLTAHRADPEQAPLPENFEPEALTRLARTSEVRELVERFRPVHFPAAFPEVFLRDRPGFDCVVGNPPWEQVVVQEQVWWGLHLPKIRGLAVGKMNAEIKRFRRQRPDLEDEFESDLEDAEEMRTLLRSAFPEMGPGRTDNYQAFSWRNWQLMREGGHLGNVLPRTALQAQGPQTWRFTVLRDGLFSDVAILLNTGGWVFDDVDGRYAVSLCSLTKRANASQAIRVSGPYSSFSDFDGLENDGSHEFHREELAFWSEAASFPQFPAHPGSVSLFRKLRAHSSIGSIGVTGSEVSVDLAKQPQTASNSLKQPQTASNSLKQPQTASNSLIAA